MKSQLLIAPAGLATCTMFRAVLTTFTLGYVICAAKFSCRVSLPYDMPRLFSVEETIQGRRDDGGELCKGGNCDDSVSELHLLR